MDNESLVAFLRSQHWAVEATVSAAVQPQAAIIGYAVTDQVELVRLKNEYFKAFPDGPSRQSWAGIAYVRVRPTWLRFSDYEVEPPHVFERSFAEHGVLRNPSANKQTEPR